MLIHHPDSGKILHHNFVSVLLNDLYGIQARGGCACAGPYAQVTENHYISLVPRDFRFLLRSSVDKTSDPREFRCWINIFGLPIRTFQGHLPSDGQGKCDCMEKSVILRELVLFQRTGAFLTCSSNSIYRSTLPHRQRTYSTCNLCLM